MIGWLSHENLQKSRDFHLVSYDFPRVPAGCPKNFALDFGGFIGFPQMGGIPKMDGLSWKNS